MRKFEKISFEQFKKDVCDDKELYESYELPKRKTKNAAGYDFFALFDKNLVPGESVIIKTGIKADMNPDEVLLILNRSSLGFKHNIRIVNQVGVIDADYYNNIDNEGQILIKIQNEGDHDYFIEKGSSIGQGMFIKFLKVDDEEEITTVRTGGIGSTNK